MTKKELAELLNVSRDTLSNWEKEPKKFNLVRMINLALLEQETYTQTVELKYLAEKIEKEIFDIANTIGNEIASEQIQKKLNEIFTEMSKINNMLHEQKIKRNKILESDKIITYKKNDYSKNKLFDINKEEDK
ncbi:helix-turn-helix transcriptional regulator [Aquamicrobium sp.]|uniref:helix-turn-helix domain-containing protein n=1 Tax=Aquamicrobium sp. TaxID=1872579 RepID=UPI0025871657|nr:helix-turn-helix transcriptional regulator [Aquamicrobium sp.]MCK9549471.1 helix-turn-helix domain-containing protein [Aquamicrobium sp.]